MSLTQETFKVLSGSILLWSDADLVTFLLKPKILVTTIYSSYMAVMGAEGGKTINVQYSFYNFFSYLGSRGPC